MKYLVVIGIFVMMLLMLAGCASTKELSVGEVAAGCKAADSASTLYLLRHGGQELNPVMDIFLRMGTVPFLAAQAAVVWAIWHYQDQMSPGQKSASIVVTCFPAVHNVVGIVR